MSHSAYFNPKKSLKLVELKKHYDFLENLYQTKKFPKALLLTGNKGEGKFTLINHFMHNIYDKSNYDIKKNIITKGGIFHKQFLDDIYPNIIYLNGVTFESVKIEDIRNLKSQLFTKPINENKRFIILDDVEIFNLNSLNALLKLIEEPYKDNFFILINNNTRPILETVKSRCLEIKIFLKKDSKKNVINYLLDYFNVEKIFNEDFVNTSPGNFVKFNYLSKELGLDISGNFIKNLNLLLSRYKKEKDIFVKNMIFYYIEYYVQSLKLNNKIDNKILIKKRLFLLKDVNNFFLYNLNQNTLLNSLKNGILNE